MTPKSDLNDSPDAFISAKVHKMAGPVRGSFIDQTLRFEASSMLSPQPFVYRPRQSLLHRKSTVAA